MNKSPELLFMQVANILIKFKNNREALVSESAEQILKVFGVESE